MKKYYKVCFSGEARIEADTPDEAMEIVAENINEYADNFDAQEIN